MGGAAVGSLLVLAVIGYAVGALGTPAESPEAAATESASPTPATPRPTPSPTPAVSPAVHVGFQYGDILRVEVDGLAVREAPLLSSPLVSGYRYSLGYAVVSEPVAEVRLEAGNMVSVELGPLQIGDTSWYQVWSAGRVDFTGERPAFDYSWSQTSWVAGSVGDNQYMTLHQRPDPHDYVLEPFGPDGPRVFTVSGTGDYESGSQARYDMFTLRWAIAPDSHPAPCAFSISLIPEAGPEAAVVVDTSTSEFKEGPRSGPNSIRNLPWGQSAGGPWDSYKVSITSGCTWAMTLVPMYHE